MEKRQKHQYTTEIELKSLLIRINNKTSNKGIESVKNNDKINKYIKWFNKINDKTYNQSEIQRKNIVKYKIKDKLIELSVKTQIDDTSYENFGAIILLMISKILSKPNFSGYTYRDDFYSDAINKILKYMHNFNHTLISERTNIQVNAFAYISQIIHNSIVYIINTKKKEQDDIKNQVSLEIINHNLNVVDYNNNKFSRYEPLEEKENNKVIQEIHFEELPNGLIYELENLEDFGNDKVHIYLKDSYKISLEEYNELKKYLKHNISILRTKSTK